MIVIKYGKAIRNPVQKIYAFLLTIVLMLAETCCKAQLNPYQAIYYQNRYLVNPAMAGLDNPSPERGTVGRLQVNPLESAVYGGAAGARAATLSLLSDSPGQNATSPPHRPL